MQESLTNKRLAKKGWEAKGPGKQTGVQGDEMQGKKRGGEGKGKGVYEDLYLVAQRITFKILILTYQALLGKAPEHLKELIAPYIPARALRSADASLLVVPPSCLRSCGDRSFVFVGPSLWNSLPRTIRAAETLQGFKKLLKTYLFSLAFE